MRLALYSDLHLEFMPVAWQPPELDVDVVILAGDISVSLGGIRWAAETFLGRSPVPQVIYVAGNHEFYGERHYGFVELMREAADRRGIVFLEKDVFEYQGVRFLGTTLWSDFQFYGPEMAAKSLREARYTIADFSSIREPLGRFLEPEDTVDFNEFATDWLAQELAKPFEGKTVVVTHFAPHRGTVAKEFEGGLMTPYFTTDMAPLMRRHPIDLWVFGHTHHNVDFVADNGCRVVSNQRGYPREVALKDNSFRPRLVIEL